MADARRAKRPYKFISIKLDADNQGRVADIDDHFGHLPIRLCLSLQWMNESITKEGWKHLKQHKGFASMGDSMVRLYEVS